MRFIGALIRLVVRLVLIPVKLVLKVGRIGFRTGVAVGTAPVKVSWWAGRRAGLKALLALAVGVVLGLLLAPVPGERLRRKLLAAVGGPDPVGPPAPATAAGANGVAGGRDAGTGAADGPVTSATDEDDTQVLPDGVGGQG